MRHFSFLLCVFLLLNLNVGAQELTVTTTSSDVTCADSCNGAIAAIVQGGMGPYTVLWNNGQTTTIIEDLCPGTYEVLVIDAVGDSIAVQRSILSPQQLTVTVENDTVCPGGMGVISSTVIGGTPPYTFIWNNGMSGPDVQMMAGTLNVMVIDGNGCSAEAPGSVIEQQTMTLEITTTDASCAGSDGTVTLSVNGGVPPYTYHLLGNPTPQNVFTDLPAGYYMLGVIDAEFCMVDSSITLNEGGLTASVVSDSLDPCLSPVTLTAIPDGGVAPYTYVWNTGATTEAITMTEAGTVTVTVTDDNGCTATAGTYAYIPDGSMPSYIMAQLRRGFCDELTAVVGNNSCATYTGPVTMSLSNNLDYSLAVPAPDVVNGNTITWNNITIPPNGQFEAVIETCVPLSASCGGLANLTITGNAFQSVHEIFIFCSFDPNDKQVYPVGAHPEGYVGWHPELTYTVRFQNTGNIAAEFIHIIDTLDTDLSISTLRVLASSHPMELFITEGNILDFFFDQINLPDSTSDLEGSQGFVIYRVTSMADLPEGTPITNTAHIIFDFNEPVITNTTLNSIGEPLGIEDGEATTPLSIHPNPSTGLFVLSGIGMGTQAVEVVNTMGQVVHLQSAQGPSVGIDLGGLPAGVYMVTVRDGNTVRHGRAVKHD